MASAGFLGALGGFGEGLNQAGKLNRESELINERVALDEARDIAREKFRSGLATAENIRGEGVASTAAADLVAARAAAATVATGAAVDAAKQKATVEATKYNAEITSRENIAGMRNNKNKFTLRTNTVSGRDGDRLVTTLFDGEGTTYELEGNKYWLPGAAQQAEGKTAPKAAVDRLMESPELAANFEAAYGYMPKKYVTKYVFTSNEDKPATATSAEPVVAQPPKPEPTVVQPPKPEEAKSEQAVTRSKKGVTLSDDALALAFQQKGAKTMAEKLAVIRDIKEQSLDNRTFGANLLAKN